MAIELSFEAQAAYQPDAWVESYQLTVGVVIRLARSSESLVALLDTAARYTVMRGDTLRELDSGPAADDEVKSISTRFGLIRGHLVRRQLMVAADEGPDVRVEAPILVSDEWEGPPVLGWTGCLERLRFALDPKTETFCFARAD